jgi:transposase-like protein
MKSLDFTRNNIKELQQSKKELRTMFWTNLENQVKFSVKDLLQQQINEEFDVFIGASWYEHAQQRRDWRNGYWYRNLDTKYGLIEQLKIPRARHSTFEITLFDRWQRFQDNLMDVILKAYLIGNSSNEVKELIHEFCASHFSREFVRKLVHNFDDQLQSYLNRPIAHPWPFLFVDGMVIRIKEGLEIKDRTVIWALGLDYDNNRSILGFIIVPTESQTAVESLIKDLYRRGLKAPKLVISDEAQTILNAVRSEYPHTDIQICTLHKLKTLGRNLLKTKLPRKTRYCILKKAAAIYKANTKSQALKRFFYFKKRYKKLIKQPLECFENNFNLTITYFNFKPTIQKTIKTNNLIERMNRTCRYLLRKYSYFHEKDNARLALFTFVCRYESKFNKSNEAITLSFKKEAA